MPRATPGLSAFTFALLLLACATPARPDYVYYQDRTAFDADVPNLPTETFESIPVGSNPFITGPSPLDQSSSPGLLPGFSLEAGVLNGIGTNLIVVTAPGTIPGASQMAGNAQLTAPLDIYFPTPVPAAGFNLAVSNGPFSALNTTVTLNVFDATGFVTSTPVTVFGSNTFIGVRATNGSNPIAHLFLTSAYCNLIDNLSFSTPISKSTYDSRAAFEAAHPGLSKEDFNVDFLGPGWDFVSGPYNAQTVAAGISPYPPGWLGAPLPGFTARCVGFSDTFAVAGDRSFPATLADNSGKIGAGGPGNSMLLTFDIPQYAVGFDLLDSNNPLTSIAGTFLIDIFTANGLLQSDTVNVPDTGAFYGITSPDPILSIKLTNTSNNGGVFIDNLTFTVPEPTSLALLTPAILLLCRRKPTY